MDREVEILTIRAFAVEKRIKPDIFQKQHGNSEYYKRNVYIEGSWINIDVYNRNNLREGYEIAGPAIIEEEGSSTFIPEHWKAYKGKYNEIKGVRL